MERYTSRDKYGTARLPFVCKSLMLVDSKELHYYINMCDEDRLRGAIERLAAYEDTGLTPRECAELKIENSNNRAILRSSMTFQAFRRVVEAMVKERNELQKEIKRLRAALNRRKGEHL